MSHKIIISHIRPDGTIQTNEEHQAGVARLAQTFASEFGMGDWGLFLGQLHDKGKERKDFQNYIRKENGMEAGDYQDKTHAWIGAIVAKQLAPHLAPFPSFAILGHHAGLCDYHQLDILKKAIPPEVDVQVESGLAEPSLDFFKSHGLMSIDRQKYIHHVVRMLFSCLVDADYLDTESFMDTCRADVRGQSASIAALLPMLEEHLSHFKADTEVNKIREQIRQQCAEAASKPTGIYSLTVPTGGGKTLSSLQWAMLHAIRNGQKRIIVAIPYTSIISQTAAIYKSIFGADNVLEHHSNYDFDEHHKGEEMNSERLAAENWDAPIVVTTNVQLFESMYASHPGKCRKLHNVANSVVILDEVQTFPAEHLQAIVDALKAYHELFNVSVLFTTASQPTLEGDTIRVANDRDSEQNLLGFDKIEEIIPREMNLHQQLRRVDLHIKEEPSSYDELAQRMMGQDRVLCIVNTRKVATKLYGALPQSPHHYHLSRMMCAEHVDATIATIKQKLKEGTEPLRVVTTQLIEAGVDIDFPVVMRQEIGLDSILQAAGRCNREGNMQHRGVTYVFKIAGEQIPRGTMSYANQARLNMTPSDDLFSPEAMNEYFMQYFNRVPDFDKKKASLGNNNIHSLLHKCSELCFDTADKYFHLIDDQSVPVVVNYGNSPQLIEQLRMGVCNRSLFRQLGRYTVNISQSEYQKLESQGLVEPILCNNKETGIRYVSNPQQYDSSMGLLTEDINKDKTIII